MGTIKVVLPDELEVKLRSKIGLTKGFHKGALSNSIVEAINLWLNKSIEDDNSKYQIDPEQLRKMYPGKFLAVAGKEVIIQTDTLEQLFEKVSNISEKIFIVHPNPRNTKVRLGWRSKVKSSI